MRLARAAALLVLVAPHALAQSAPLSSTIELLAESPEPLPPGAEAVVDLAVRHTAKGPAPVVAPFRVSLSFEDVPSGISASVEPETVTFEHPPCGACVEQVEEKRVQLRIGVAPGTPAASLLRLAILAEGSASDPYGPARSTLDLPLDVAWIPGGSLTVAPEDLALGTMQPRVVELTIVNEGNAAALFTFRATRAPAGVEHVPPPATSVARGASAVARWTFHATRGASVDAGPATLAIDVAPVAHPDRAAPFAEATVLVRPPSPDASPNEPAAATPEARAPIPGPSLALALALAGALALVRRSHA